MTDRDSRIVSDHPVPHLASADTIITINDVGEWFGQFQALRDITLQVATGERIVVCGPSGSGESTMIRCINSAPRSERARSFLGQILHH